MSYLARLKASVQERLCELEAFASSLSTDFTHATTFNWQQEESSLAVSSRADLAEPRTEAACANASVARQELPLEASCSASEHFQQKSLGAESRSTGGSSEASKPISCGCNKEQKLRSAAPKGPKTPLTRDRVDREEEKRKPKGSVEQTPDAQRLGQISDSSEPRTRHTALSTPNWQDAAFQAFPATTQLQLRRSSPQRQVKQPSSPTKPAQRQALGVPPVTERLEQRQRSGYDLPRCIAGKEIFAGGTSSAASIQPRLQAPIAAGIVQQTPELFLIESDGLSAADAAETVLQHQLPLVKDSSTSDGLLKDALRDAEAAADALRRFQEDRELQARHAEELARCWSGLRTAALQGHWKDFKAAR